MTGRQVFPELRSLLVPQGLEVAKHPLPVTAQVSAVILSSESAGLSEVCSSALKNLPGFNRAASRRCPHGIVFHHDGYPGYEICCMANHRMANRRFACCESLRRWADPPRL